MLQIIFHTYDNCDTVRLTADFQKHRPNKLGGSEKGDPTRPYNESEAAFKSLPLSLLLLLSLVVVVVVVVSLLSLLLLLVVVVVEVYIYIYIHTH